MVHGPAAAAAAARGNPLGSRSHAATFAGSTPAAVSAFWLTIEVTAIAVPLNAVVGILAGLVARDRTGRGAAVDVSMLEGALSWVTMPAASVLAASVVLQRVDEAGRVLATLGPVVDDGTSGLSIDTLVLEVTA